MYRSDAIDDVVKTADAVPGVGGLEENHDCKNRN
jgi:hypothetical protein